MNRYLVIPIALLLCFVSVAQAADVSMSESSVITVASINLTVSGTATMDSVTVGPDSFSAVLSKGGSITITSTDRRSFTVSPSQYQESFSCGDSQSTATIANNLWDTAVTVTVTPSTDTCSSGGGGVLISGGGGAIAPVIPSQTASAAVTTPAPVVSEQPAVITAPTITVEQPSVAAQTQAPVFVSSLKYGISSDEVKKLQIVLAQDPSIYPEGLVTGYFGNATKKAVAAFQEKYGMEAVGSVGPKTRAKLNELYGSVSPVTGGSTGQQSAPAQISTNVSAVFTGGLAKGMSSNDVKRLQQLLNSDSETKIAESGVGSPGNETEYFGGLTEQAVQKFQKKYNLAQEGDTAYGYVGPKTRAKLMEIFGQ